MIVLSCSSAGSEIGYPLSVPDDQKLALVHCILSREKNTRTSQTSIPTAYSSSVHPTGPSKHRAVSLFLPLYLIACSGVVGLGFFFIECI